MKKMIFIVSILVMSLGVGYALSGHKGTCPLSTQECLETLYARYSIEPFFGIEFDETVTDKAQIMMVLADSPADQAGLQVGDVIQTIGGVKIIEFFKKAAQETEDKPVEKTDDGAAVVFLRNGEKMEVTVKFVPRSPEIIAEHIGAHMIENHLPKSAK